MPRMLRVVVESQDLRVADLRALESGFLRWLDPTETHEIPDSATARKWIKKAGGGLLPADEATAKLCGMGLSAIGKPAPKPSKAEAKHPKKEG